MRSSAKSRTRRPVTHVIDDPRQLSTLRSPVRQQILWALERRRACSVSEIAALVEQPAESLYYHVHKLAQAGLLVPAGQRPAGKRTELLYELVADTITVDPASRSEALLEELGSVASAAFRAAARNHRRALRAAATGAEDRRGVAELRQWSVRLDDDALAGLRRRLTELERYLASHDDADGSAGYTVTVAFSRRGNA